MKTGVTNLFILSVVIVGLVLILAGRVTAQTFRVLHTFIPDGDGANPSPGLVLSGSALYGTARAGGSSGAGTVFKVNTDGTDFRILHNLTNSDGKDPIGRLHLSSNTLYGTTSGGGTSGYGTVFAINLDRSGFTTLHSFAWRNADSSGVYTNSDGANPYDYGPARTRFLNKALCGPGVVFGVDRIVGVALRHGSADLVRQRRHPL